MIYYTNDILQQIVSRHGKSILSLAGACSAAIKHISDYERKWKIKTNPSKFVVFSPFNQSGKLKGKKLVNIDKDTNVAFSTSTTILGLHIRSKGSNYTNHTTSKKSNR